MTIACLLEWLKLKRMTILGADEDVREIELSYNVLRDAKWYNHFGKLVGWEVSTCYLTQQFHF